VVVLQDNRFEDTASVTVCPLTTDPTDVPLVRPVVVPTDENGLVAPCRIMVDKITTIPRSRLGAKVGRLDGAAMTAVERAMFVFLGLAGG
jgi:mRNA interferase MazF